MISWNDNTTVMFHLENAAGLKGYAPDADDVDDTTDAAFKVDGELIACDTISGKNGEWYTTLGANYTGQTIEMTLTPVVVTDTVS